VPIIGVGIDVVDVERFVQSIDRTPTLCQRLFTPAERELPISSLAARFAAKEALSKALGGPVGLHWHDVEIVRESGGRPGLQVRGTVEDAARRLGVKSWHLSMSHDGGAAVAVVIAEG
jgi:holo-[acyl-carrier protein] synthase